MKKSFLQLTKVTLLILLCITFCCKQQVMEGLTEEEAKAITDRVLEIWNDGNLALVDEVYAPEVVVHSSSSPEDMVGFEGIKGWVTNTRTAFPDFKMTFDEIIVKGDKIVTRWTSTGTHTGTFHMPFGDLPPTGKKINVSGVAINKIENRKAVDELVVFNVLDMLQQLGFTLVPPSMESEK